MAKTRQINLRLDEQEVKIIEKAAKNNGLPTSSYVRHVALAAAKRVKR
jgi:uncharacterized protein (DUF1778 family)